MTGKLRTAIFGAAALGLLSVGASWAEETGRVEKEGSSSKATQSPRTGLDDAQIAAWLVVESGLHEQVSEFAAQRAHNSAIQQFAQAAVQSHKELLAQLPKAGKVEGQATANVAKTLKEIAQRWEETAGTNRQVLGFRGSIEPQDKADSKQAAEQAAEQAEQKVADLTKKLKEKRKAMADERREQRTEAVSAENRKERVAERRTEGREMREAIQEMNDLRRQRQEARRELLQARLQTSRRGALAERVPQVLRTIGALVQEVGTMSGAAPFFADIEQQVAKRTAEAIKKSLEEKTGRDFDRAYLGYVLVSQMKMISMLEVAMERASGDLLPTLDRSLAAARDRLREARELLQELAGSDKG